MAETPPVAPATARTTVARDGCVVDTEPLASLVTGFIRSWNTRHESRSGRFTGEQRRNDVDHVSAMAWLESETGVPRTTIQNIKLARYPTTELRVADALVAALDAPEAFHDGRLTVRPNPAASAEARRSCRCGGASS